MTRRLMRAFQLTNVLLMTRITNQKFKHFAPLKKSIPTSFNYFHCPPSLRRNCDWGRPCDCSECRDVQKRLICERCDRRLTTRVESSYGVDRKGIGGYNFTSYCDPCWNGTSKDDDEEDPEVTAIKEKENLKALQRMKMEKMLEDIQKIELTHQISVSYAATKLQRAYVELGRKPRQHDYCQQVVLSILSEELQIVGLKRNLYLCNRKRVDAMDFQLWNPHNWYTKHD